MPQYITDLQVSLNHPEEIQLRKDGYSQIPVDLNAGAGGNDIYLWYKTSDSSPITRIQFSFTEEMKEGLKAERYHQVEKNLNAGSSGSPIYLWFFKGSPPYDVPIVELDLSTDAKSDAKKAQPLWERSACDLNREAGGKWIYLWMKRESQTYICDITATDSSSSHADLFRQGYIRVDENANRGAGGREVNIWYRQSTDSTKAIKDLQVSLTEESKQSYENHHYEQVKTNLNEGTLGSEVYLWYKKKECSKDPIKMFSLILDMNAVHQYENAGVQVIQKNLNNNNPGWKEYLCYN